MKKLISILGISTLVITSTMTLVSCGFGGQRFGEIYVITDAGKVSDKSFNQSGYMGGNRFIHNALSKPDKDEISYAQPATMTDAPWMYDRAFNSGAKALILPGFKHANFLETANNGAEGAGGVAILIDGSATRPNGDMYENTIGLSYRSDMSGFWAGTASIMHMLKTNPGVTPTLGTFGGMQNATAVDPFMAGFLASVLAYNDAFDGDSEVVKEKYKKIGISFELDANFDYKNSKAAISANQEKGYFKNEHSQWFTDSFDPGKGSDISETLINDKNKSNVVMPVAGPQTADTLKVLKEEGKKGKAFVVGVDTDQVEMYSSDADLFITSAEKDIVGSTALALAHSGVFNDELKEASNDDPEFNEKLSEMGNNLSVTTKDEETGEIGSDPLPLGLDFEKLDESDWKGMDLWLGGSISTSDLNKVEEENFKIMKEELGDSMLTASLEYFKFVGEGNNTPDKTLSIETIQKYATTVLDGMSETNYGGFLSYGK
ncbi:hypothetical protein [Spiroplasma endosymbiont of Othius punctulatus]|uniref:hypothetical protein n=1 Tax=Spiroplasma endosymbiont of Othius punctulatus TaxID=3066289 RepID=UPI0030CF03A8